MFLIRLPGSVPGLVLYSTNTNFIVINFIIYLYFNQLLVKIITCIHICTQPTYTYTYMSVCVCILNCILINYWLFSSQLIRFYSYIMLTPYTYQLPILVYYSHRHNTKSFVSIPNTKSSKLLSIKNWLDIFGITIKTWISRLIENFDILVTQL